jgi:hypothetical protein
MIVPLNGKLKNALSNAMEKGLVVHYSCESFNQNKLHLPKVLYALLIENGLIVDSKVFNFMDSTDIQETIRDFYDFLRQNSSRTFCSWQMQNEKFGLEHLDHIAKTYSVRIYKIPIEKILDIKQLYTHKYPTAEQSKLKMKNLFIANNLDMSDFIDGIDEAIIGAQESYKVKNSTICKTHHIFTLAKLIHYDNDRLFELDRRKTRSLLCWGRIIVNFPFFIMNLIRLLLFFKWQNNTMT